MFYLGESFSPTPLLPDYSQFRLDILQFCYRLRWAWYFYKNPPKAKTSEVTTKELAIKDIEQKLVEKKETKAIQFCNNPCLELYIQRVSKELLQTNSERTSVVPDNIPKEVREALQEMRKWKDVVIRPADKGSKFFVLDRCDYVERILVHLNDKETFVEVADQASAIEAVNLAIHLWCAKYAEEEGMTEAISSAIKPDDKCKPGNNYLLLKAHKPQKTILVG